ncbi:MAG: DNA primase [Clostridia bacterium]|nr:DNA primase [Clostridia bacterium]
MPIPEEFIQELKHRSDIVDVVSSYVSLKKSGRTLMGLCPFHNEKSPSFSVSAENGYFHCFGCGAGGDVITFIKRIENLDYIDAVKFLAQRAGMAVPEGKSTDGLTKLRTRIYEANREAAKFYNKFLYTPQGKDGLDYLKSRHLSDKTIIHFGLGYSPKSRFELVNHLKKKGFTDSELIQANLANKSDKGYLFDRFSDRVMFPILDLKGNVIAFGGRIMSDIKPKYLNTSDTPAFNKSRNLFALQFAKNKAKGQLILVEGYMDVIALHQAGFENAVATLGTSLTNEQATIIKRYCEEIVICYDSDEAGQKATSRAISILRPTGLRIKILKVPSGKDPDEFISSYGEQGPARFRMLLEKSGNDAEYRLQSIRSKYDLDITEQRVEFLTEAAQLISTFDNRIEQDIYTAKLAEELGVNKDAITQQVQRFYNKRSRDNRIRVQREIRDTLAAKNDRINIEKAANLRAANAEEALIAIIMYDPGTAMKIFQRLPPEKFVTSFNRKVYETLKQHAENGYDFTLTDISGEFSNDEISSITRIIASHPREINPDEASDVCIRVLEDEAQKMTPEQIANADAQTLREQIQKLKEKKK